VAVEVADRPGTEMSEEPFWLIDPCFASEIDVVINLSVGKAVATAGESNLWEDRLWQALNMFTFSQKGLDDNMRILGKNSPSGRIGPSLAPTYFPSV
jgi:hypothetical protein